VSEDVNRAAAGALRYIEALPADLRPIVLAVFDLAYYRTVPIGDDLGRAVAHELVDRTSKLPEYQDD
jgi:hypothetical protein